MNIILKSFDGEYCKKFIERGFQDIVLDTCISIMNDKEQWPELTAKEHIWYPAEPLRTGKYSDTDWNSIAPIDEELIENMRDCEAVFLTMIERYAQHGDIPYAERKRQYLSHLRFWNHILDTKKIDLLLMNHVPHQCYDYVLYCLCKLKGIPTLSLERASAVDAFFIVEDWKTSGKEVETLFHQLQKQYSDPGTPIPLSERYEKYFDTLTCKKESPWYTKKQKPRMQKSFFQRWGAVAFKALLKKPFTFFASVLSLQFWERKIRQHKIHLLYERNVQSPDFSRPFVYLPLHMQPEATTCPMSGIFTDQERIVEILASCLPPDISIYVKEHPFQGELCRSEDFYRSLMEISSVIFVPKDCDTFALIENSIAVVTGTGTAGFEALFKGKPVLMFGHRFFQYAPGVHRVRNTEDCKNALDSILHKKEAPNLRDLRLYLKAMEECTTPFVGGPDTSLSKEEKAQMMGKAIANKLQPYLST